MKTKVGSLKRILSTKLTILQLHGLRKKKIQITKIRNKSGDTTIDSTEIQRIIREFYEKLYTNTLNNLDEMDKFLKTQNLPRLRKKQKI